MNFIDTDLAIVTQETSCVTSLETMCVMWLIDKNLIKKVLCHKHELFSEILPDPV